MQGVSSAISAESALAVLPASLRACFVQRFGDPTPSQRAAWPALASGSNLLLSAPTGSGKTLAAFLPLLGGVLDAPPTHSVRLLYLTPLKALAADVRRNLRSFLAALAPHLPEGTVLPRLALRTGDSSPRDRQRLWTEPPEILLTTPESLALLLTYPAARELFGGLRAVIVDEVHALAAGKRGADLSLSLERLERLTSRALQRIGLSATSTPLEESARFLTGIDRPCVLAHVSDSAALDLRSQPLPPGPTFLARLLDLLGPELTANRSTLVFTNTRSLSERLSWGLRRRHPEWDAQIAVHHSSLPAERRRRIERRLKRGRLRAVVCSTSLELGIDIGSIDLVVLVHPPGDVVRLLQRVGRAGHAPGQARRGLLLTSGPAELLEAAVTTASGRLRECEPLQLAETPLDVLIQQLLGMASTSAWEPDEAFALVRRARPFHDLSRDDFDACLDYLSGGSRERDSPAWLPARLSWEDGRFQLLDERTLRVLRRNLGTILAETECEVVLEASGGREPPVADSTGGSRPPLASVVQVGEVGETFAEQLAPGERFLLDGRCLEFRRLERSPGRNGRLRLVTVEVVGRPRVPRWASEGWPMSPELARRLFAFRARAAESLREGPTVLADLLREEYGLEGEAVADLSSLFLLQEAVSEVPDASVLLIEAVPAQSLTTCYLHTPLNRRANDVLARVVGLRLARRTPAAPPVVSLVANLGLALYLRGVELKPEDFRCLLSANALEEDLRACIEESLLLRERFQRVALTGLMLLRNPLGRQRRVGGRDWSERQLFDQIRSRQADFVLLRQARREVLAGSCDLAAARAYLEELPRLAVRWRELARPSPFVEGWTQAEPSLAGPLPTAEEVLRRLHAAFTGADRELFSPED